MKRRGIILLLSLFSVLGAHGQDASNLLSITVWDVETQLLTGLGYRDNVLRSGVIHENSSYVYSSLDFSVMRLSESDTFFMLYGLGEDHRYLESDSVNYEQFFSLTARGSVPVVQDHKLGIDANYFYIHQVFDVSDTQINPQQILVEGHSGRLMPFWQYSFSERIQWELNGTAFRQIYEVDLDNYWEFEGQAKFTVTYGNRSSVGCFYRLAQRDYDTLEQRDLAGSILAGTHLSYQQHEVDAVWKHYMDKQRRWRNRLKFSGLESEDNGSGYFNYNRYRVGEQIRWKADKLTIELNFMFGHYEYINRVVAGNVRERSYMQLSGLVTYMLSTHWLLHGNAEYVDEMNSVASDEFQTWALTVGAGYSF